MITVTDPPTGRPGRRRPTGHVAVPLSAWPPRDQGALVVLDAHGVVFNRAFPTFVHRRARERDEDPTATWERWRRYHRLDLWEGRTTPNEMWTRLFPGDDPRLLTAGLAQTYGRGPWFDYVTSTTSRMWLLSNHHSGWLIPQLRRFGLQDRFERVLVSDQLGIAKPSPKVFEMVRHDAGEAEVLLFDDSAANVTAALTAGLAAQRVVSATESPLCAEPGT